MGVILFGIYIVLSIVLTVIGVFIGNIIFFDSILLAALSGLLCHTLWTVHPAFCLLIGIAPCSCCCFGCSIRASAYAKRDAALR